MYYLMNDICGNEVLYSKAKDTISSWVWKYKDALAFKNKNLADAMRHRFLDNSKENTKKYYVVCWDGKRRTIL